MDIVGWIHNEPKFWPPILKLKGNSGKSTHRHIRYWLFKFQLDDFHKIHVTSLAAKYSHHGGRAGLHPPGAGTFSLQLLPSRRENLCLLCTLLPAGDAREVEIGETQNVFGIGKG